MSNHYISARLEDLRDLVNKENKSFPHGKILNDLIERVYRLEEDYRSTKEELDSCRDYCSQRCYL